MAGSGAGHAPYSVFRSQKDGSYAVVIANYSSSAASTFEVEVEGRQAGVYRLVDDRQWRGAADVVGVRARSAAVGLEHTP